MVYTVCNFYPSFETLIPAAIYLGICAAPLWSSQCQYLTISAGEMSKSKGGTSQNWVNRFFGSFFFIFQLNQLFGNLISSLVIQGGFPDSSSLPEATEDEINQVRQRCGLSFKASDDGGCDSIEPIDDTTVYTLMGIYTGCGVVAISMVALLVDPLEVPEMDEKESTWKLAQTTLRRLKIKLNCCSFLLQFIVDWNSHS